jgi:hypothetical protein
MAEKLPGYSPRLPDVAKPRSNERRSPAFPEYSCHGTWVENDTAYLVASTEAGRYCLVYSTLAATSTGSSSSRELTVSGHLASCPRATHSHKHEWQVNLTAYGESVCDFLLTMSPSDPTPLSSH